MRQSYARVGKILLKQQSRYAQVKQFKRATCCRRKLRTILGRVIRDIERKRGGQVGLELAELSERAKRIHARQCHDKKKLSSLQRARPEGGGASARARRTSATSLA